MSEWPAAWAQACFAEITTKIGSGATPRGGGTVYKHMGTPLIRSMNVHFSGFKDDGLVFLDEAQARKLDNVTVLPNDVLLNITGASIGRVTVAPERLRGARVNQHVAIIRLRDGIEPRFVSNFLSSPMMQLLILTENYGATRQALTKVMIEDMRIPIPPLPEQRRIVAKIDSLSVKSRRARDHLDHIPRLVEKYKQTILAAAFRGELTRECRARHPGPSKVTPRADQDIRRKYAAASSGFEPPYKVPNGWLWLRLPQLGELDRGKSRHRPRNDRRLFGGPYPFIQTGEVRGADRYLTSYNETYSELGLAQSRLWPAGTVCITIAANIAETAMLTFEACFPDSVVGFLPDADKADASYVEFFLRTARTDLEAFAPATAQKNINLDTLGSVRVPMASLREQHEIVRQIETAFAWIDRLASEATSARKLIERLDQTVLAKAFRGELLPQDPNDEPASVLLERIKAGPGLNA